MQILIPKNVWSLSEFIILGLCLTLPSPRSCVAHDRRRGRRKGGGGIRGDSGIGCGTGGGGGGSEGEIINDRCQGFKESNSGFGKW